MEDPIEFPSQDRDQIIKTMIAQEGAIVWSDKVFRAVTISLRLSHSQLTALAIYIYQ